ncbi:thioester reductase domain-containing protein [Streptomyces sp. NPDC087300]|uniref:thioester reductase domain-containing protein n=1 Tax=Streptomyces sp. NPDC087300 TaxID=3365780 RepID=UPI0038042089
MGDADVDVNMNANDEDPAARGLAETGQRTTGESIERGGGGIGVAGLLAKVGATASKVAAAGSAAAGNGASGDAVSGDAPVGSAASGNGAAGTLAEAISAIAARFLPGVPMGPDTDFFDVGGTSVDAVELVAALSREIGVEVGLDDVFADARPRRLAERTLAQDPAYAPSPASLHAASHVAPHVAPEAAPHAPSHTPATHPPHLPIPAARPLPVPAAPAPASAPDEDLALVLADLARADTLPWARRPEPVAPRRVLLTGATGFLGGHMLLDLLRHSDAHVVCLVRAADEEAGLARLGAALSGFSLPWSSEIRRRVTVLPGDLREPRLGLTEERWRALADEVDSVVGVGAAVDFLRGYASLRRSNVAGPLALAELAAAGRPKPLHHISSIAVFNEVGIESMGEDDPVAHIDALAAGYDKSKWAAEAALRRAREHGLVVTMLRPGGIGGHTKTGAGNPQDLSSGMMSAFSRFRTVPGFRYINAAPVDWVSRIAVAVVCEPDAWGYNYNLTGVPSALSDVVRDMKFAGMNVRVQDWDEWRQDVVRRLKAEPVPELDFLARVLESPTARKLCEATLKGPAVTCERTEAFVAEQGLPAAVRYGMREQTEAFERLARDGLARLPDRSDPPYLWFPETMEGALGPVGASADSRCTLSLTLSIASMYQLVRERRVDVRGELSCPLLHPEPLVVERGDLWVRPEEGIPLEHGMRHPLLRYRLLLRDADGRQWWLEGRKFARARRDLWRQTRALSVRLGREGQPATLAGEVVVPSDSYVRDQVDGIRVDPRLSGQEKRVAKLTWLAWFGLEIGRGLLAPFARVGADLLDLRGTTTPTERTR